MRGMICMTSAISLVSPFWSAGGKGQDKSFFPKACKIVLCVEHVFLVVVDPMGNHVGRAMCRLMLLDLGVYL